MVPGDSLALLGDGPISPSDVLLSLREMGFDEPPVHTATVRLPAVRQ